MRFQPSCNDFCTCRIVCANVDGIVITRYTHVDAHTLTKAGQREGLRQDPMYVQ